MEKLSLDEIKKIELSVLKDFHEICIKNNYNYSLAGGSLLGAVRHKGFIPWDDDIDVMMPRSDYEKFLNYCNQNQVPFGIVNSRVDNEYGDLTSKIYALNTVIEDELIYTSKEIGLHIDIFPIDNLGSTYEDAKKHYFKTAFLREKLNASNWKKFTRSKTHGLAYEPFRLFFYLISRFSKKEKIVKKIEDYYINLEINHVEYAGAVGGCYRVKEILPVKVFNEYQDILFENNYFKAIKNYDAYLKSLYGDYMKLPPVEKQAGHHTFSAYYKEK